VPGVLPVCFTDEQDEAASDADRMKHIVLINPNTSVRTTDMMTGIAQRYLPQGYSISGMTADRGVSMITDIAALQASESGVVEMGLACAETAQGIIISAFGDPGLEALRAALTIPVVGLCEASMIAASRDGRKFGIATVTPELVPCFAEKARALGLAMNYTGTRLTNGDPEQLAADPAALLVTLDHATRECFLKDHADAVIIGGGPLGQAAETLQKRFASPVISPIRCAVESLVAALSG
jgi:Asp/Glu/hydantoin racemase